MTALTELLAKVEAGVLLPVDLVFLPAFQHAWVWKAYRDDDLNAARALHEAVLPGWVVRHVWGGPLAKGGNKPFPYTHVFRPRHSEDDAPLSANSAGYAGHNLARAWLIAIIRALIAQEKA